MNTDNICCDPDPFMGVAPPPIPGQLSGLVWLLPCKQYLYIGGCFCAENVSSTTTLVGTAGQTYDLTLRIRGIVELNSDYTGGTLQPNTSGVCVAGATQNLCLLNATPGASTYNVYLLKITCANPAYNASYYLNNWDSPSGSQLKTIGGVDYQITIPAVPVGASLTLQAISGYPLPGDGVQVDNGFVGTPPAGVPIVTSMAGPFPVGFSLFQNSVLNPGPVPYYHWVLTPADTDPPLNPAIVQDPYYNSQGATTDGGQFLQMDVVSVTQH